MLLEFTLQEGRGKVIELATAGNCGCGLETVMVAIGAPVLLTKHDILQKCFHVVAILIDNFQVYMLGVGFESIFTPLALLVWMDITVIEKTHYLKAL